MDSEWEWARGVNLTNRYFTNKLPSIHINFQVRSIRSRDRIIRLNGPRTGPVSYLSHSCQSLHSFPLLSLSLSYACLFFHFVVIYFICDNFFLSNYLFSSLFSKGLSFSCRPPVTLLLTQGIVFISLEFFTSHFVNTHIHALYLSFVSVIHCSISFPHVFHTYIQTIQYSTFTLSLVCLVLQLGSLHSTRF